MSDNDNIGRPSHYQINDGCEVIDVREWWLNCIVERLHDADASGNPHYVQEHALIACQHEISHLDRALEYLLRAPVKNGMGDVHKAYQYLHRAIYGEWPHE